MNSDKKWDVIHPVGDRVLVIKDKDSSKTKGGIVLPGNSEIPNITGRILAVSPQIAEDYRYSNIRQYARGLFNFHNAVPVSYEPGDERYIIYVDNVVAIFDSEDPPEHEVGVPISA
jgi:chaperonin GroES